MILRAAISALVLLVGIVAHGQSIRGMTILTNGWQAWVDVDGLGTNGTYALGWGTNNTPSSGTKLRLTVDSPGFDSSATAITVQRTIYAGKRVRFPYPGQSFAAESTTSTGVRLLLSLTHTVFAGDTNILAEIASGLYAHGGTNSAAASGVSVTNNSTMQWPLPIANWTWPGWNRETGSTMRLRAFGVGGQRPWPSGPTTWGRPVAAMKFIASDIYGNSVTQVVSQATIDRTLPDLIPTGEYIADISLSTFTNGSPIRCDFMAYPHLGNSASIHSTLDNRYTAATHLPKAITNLCDRLGTYSSIVAVVDPVGGSDSNGRTTNVAHNLVLTNHYFATLAKALQSVRTNNASAHGHDDVGGGQVYATSNVVSWLGGSQSYGTNPLANVTIQPMPGHAVTLTNQTGNQDISDRFRIVGVTVGGAASLFSGTDYLWLDQCVISNTSAGLAQNSPSLWLTHCRVPLLSGGLRAVSNQDTGYQMRGCDFTGFTGGIIAKTMVGCIHPQREGAALTTLVTDPSSGTSCSPEWTIHYNNLMAVQSTSEATYFGRNLPTQWGMALVQNVYVITTNATGGVHNFGGATYPHTNFVVAHNEIGGKRIAGLGYNDTGTNQVNRILWALHANFIENAGMKTDTFGTASGARVGNWMLHWGVDFSHNVHANINSTGVEAPASFVPEFWGIASYHPLDVFTNTVEWMGFVDRRAPGGTNGVEGVGNWRFRSDSAVWDIVPDLDHDYLVPYDLEGYPRSPRDPAGPYAAGNRRKGAAFIWN